MNRVSLDTNLLAPLFVAEPDNGRIGTWQQGSAIIPVFSDLTVLEFSAAISRLVREHRISLDEARAPVWAFTNRHEERGDSLAVTRQTFTRARGFVEQPAPGIRGPDALHLGLVRVTGLPFATFDARLRAAAAALNLPRLTPPPL